MSAAFWGLTQAHQYGEPLNLVVPGSERGCLPSEDRGLLPFMTCP